MTLRQICMHCGRHYGDVGSDADQGDTHGICPECWPKVQEEERNSPSWVQPKEMDKDLQTFIERMREYFEKEKGGGT